MGFFKSEKTTLRELCDLQRTRIAELEKQLAERDEECKMYLDEAVEIAEERDTWRKLADERLRANEKLRKNAEKYESLIGSMKTNLCEGQKVWVIKAKFIYGRAHVQQISSLDHFKRISELEAIFFVTAKLASKTDADKLDKFVFLTEAAAEAKLKEYLELKEA